MGNRSICALTATNASSNLPPLGGQCLKEEKLKKITSEKDRQSAVTISESDDDRYVGGSHVAHSIIIRRDTPKLLQEM